MRRAPSLDLAPAPLSAIGAAAGLDAPELTAAYGSPAGAGTGEDMVAPVPPAADLEILVRQRASETEESRIAVGAPSSRFGAGGSPRTTTTSSSPSPTTRPAGRRS